MYPTESRWHGLAKPMLASQGSERAGMVKYRPVFIPTSIAACRLASKKKRGFSRTTDPVAYSKFYFVGKWFATPCETEDIVFQMPPKMLFWNCHLNKVR